MRYFVSCPISIDINYLKNVVDVLRANLPSDVVYYWNRQQYYQALSDTFAKCSALIVVTPLDLVQKRIDCIFVDSYPNGCIKEIRRACRLDKPVLIYVGHRLYETEIDSDHMVMKLLDSIPISSINKKSMSSKKDIRILL